MATLPAPLLSHPRLSDWLSFSEPGVIVVRSGRVELGQGVSAALISMVAAEFQIDKDRIRIISGNTQCCPNEGFTAGSASISVGGMSLRIVSRHTFRLFKEQAAIVLQTSVNQIDIIQGCILHEGVDTGLTLWDQAEAIDWDSTIPENSSAELAEAKTDRLNERKSFPPNNLIKRLSGREFIHDFELPDMLHARVVTPLNYQARLSRSVDELSATIPRQVSLLCRNSFVAVVSKREELVEATAKKLHELGIWSLEETDGTSLKETHPIDDFPADSNVDYRSQSSGDSSDGLSDSSSDVRAVGKAISVEIERPCLSHASIGPGCAVARYAENKLTVWSHSQGVFPLRNSIASMLALEPDAVHIIHMPGAGCYGHNSADDVAADAAITAMLKPGVPIRVQYSRADEFQKSPLGPAMRTACKAALDDQGQLAKVQVNLTSPPHSSRPSTNGAINLRSAMLIQPFDQQQSDRERYLFKLGEPPLKVGGGCHRNAVPAYRIPDVEVVVNRLSQLSFRVSSLRGLGAFANVLSIEAMMDECAASTGIGGSATDPVDYRLQHLDDPRARAVIQKVAELAGGDRDESLGIGYARYKNSAAYCACMARVSIDEEIKVEQLWIAADAGENINPDGIKAQLEGGAIQAMSWLLNEAAPIAGHTTRVRDWDDYPIARFSDVPKLSVELLEPASAAPLGCGEASQGPAAAAIYNAACRVLGARPGLLPLTRERLMSQLLNVD